MSVDFTRKDPPWVDVPDPENPPAGASKIMASDLNRYEDALESLAAESGAIEVDTSVGTRVFVGGVMVHGDTGRRNISDSLINGWTGYAHVQRIGSVLWLYLYNIDPTDATDHRFLKLPDGFNWGGTGASIQVTETLVSYDASRRELSLSRNVDSRYFNGGYHVGSAILSRAWPTTLPGNPA